MYEENTDIYTYKIIPKKKSSFTGMLWNTSYESRINFYSIHFPYGRERGERKWKGEYKTLKKKSLEERSSGPNIFPLARGGVEHGKMNSKY